MNLDKNVLTIAGSDSSGGAGIQADLKTFSANGVYGMSVITSVTSQNSLGVNNIENLSGSIIKSQIDSLFSDIRIDAVKIGMIPDDEVAVQIADSLMKWKYEKTNNHDFDIVLDPVMISSSGKELMSDEAKKVVVEKIFPLCSLITPNIPEAESLTGVKINSYKSLKRAAETLIDMGPKYVLIKGGHMYESDAIDLDSSSEDKKDLSVQDKSEEIVRTECNDLLFDGQKYTEFKGKRVDGVSPHGTGCTLSSAIAANLAKGADMAEAIKKAKEYITICIKNSIEIGQGDCFLNHFANL